MSEANPRKGVAALLPRTIEVGGGYAVRPLSLGMYALLERIKSPMLDSAAKPDTLELVPTLYVMTHDPMDSLAGNLFEKSVAWADTVDPGMLVRIRDAAVRQIAAMTDVIPEAAPKKKAVTTAGSSDTRSSRPKPTAGAMTKSCGGRRHPRSQSSGGRTSSSTATTRHSR
jgi:hypothetical protein